MMFTVTVYSLPADVCVKCRAVEISMRRRGIAITKVMVNENPEAMEYVKSLGYTEAPVIVVTDGEEIVDHWSGFSDDKVLALRDMVAA